MSAMNVECGIHFLGERENDKVSQIHFLERENDKIFQIQDKSIFEGSENDDSDLFGRFERSLKRNLKIWKYSS